MREQALTLAYDIILVAPDDEKAQAARILADEFAVGLDESTVEMCRASALREAGGRRGDYGGVSSYERSLP